MNWALFSLLLDSHGDSDLKEDVRLLMKEREEILKGHCLKDVDRIGGYVEFEEVGLFFEPKWAGLLYYLHKIRGYDDLDDLIDNRLEIIRDMEGLRLLSDKDLKELDAYIDAVERLVEIDDELEEIKDEIRD